MYDKIALVGARGNMGKRYSSIMRWLQIPFIEFDLHNIDDIYYYKQEIKSVILATPTEAHTENLMFLKDLGPILCEKPISKSWDDIKFILSEKIPVKMVNQYEYLAEKGSKGVSHYHYFKSGDDGLHWDCINIIGLADFPPEISNNSPVWRCAINGIQLRLSDMDWAYCRMIEDWHNDPHSDLDYIKKAHSKVLKGFYNDRSFDRHTSPLKQY